MAWELNHVLSAIQFNPSLCKGPPGVDAEKGQKVIKMKNTLQRTLVLVTSGISELFGQHIE